MLRGLTYWTALTAVLLTLYATNGYTQFFTACTTQAECARAREAQRERLRDRGESSVLFEAYRTQRGDADRRQVEEIMRQWDAQRSRGGFPCLPHEARCNE